MGRPGIGASGGPGAWADKNRAAFSRAIGLGGVTGDDGRPDLEKTLGAVKSFCR